MCHLKQIFEQYRKYGIFLNPKKSIFGVLKCTLLGHIIAKNGIKFDLKRVKTIAQILLPVNKKDMQSFPGTINFLHKFISDYVQIVKPLQEMIKKDEIYKWDKRENDVFSCIKQVIADAPALFSLDYGKDFLLYTFTLDSSIAIVLTQKDVEGNEKPIYFMSVGLQGSELNYPSIDKKAYVVYKVVYVTTLVKNPCKNI